MADALGVRFLAHHIHAERVLAATRAELEEREFAAAWSEGRRLSIEQAVTLARRVLTAPPPVRQSAAVVKSTALTAREQDVLRLLVAGHPDREIAAALRISPRTVQTHVASLFSKFGVNSRVELTAVAVRRGHV